MTLLGERAPGIGARVDRRPGVRRLFDVAGQPRARRALDVPPGSASSPERHLPALLVWWRWFACAAAVGIRLAHPAGGALRGVLTLSVAAAATAVVTAAGPRGWAAVARRWVLLVPDVVVSALLLAAGGVDVFLLYALSTLLAAGVLFGPRAVVAALAGVGAIVGVAELAGLRPGDGALPEAWTWTAVAGGVLLCVAVADTVAAANRASSAAAGEAALRLSLEAKNNELTRRNRELQTFEEIASTMQTTMDASEVQERVVVGLTDRIGYTRAVLGLSDQTEARVTGWLAAAHGRPASTVDHLFVLDLEGDGGAVSRAWQGPDVTMLTRAEMRSEGDTRLLAAFDGDAESLIAVPIRCRGHLVGGLLIEAPRGATAVDPDTRHMLDRLGTQAGLALANVRLCVERTQKLTVEQERLRIATDMHDGIAQALFGIVFQLSGVVRRLPADGSPLRRQLEDLGGVAQGALHQVRHAIFDIWPAHLTAEALTRELEGPVHSLAPTLALDVVVSPQFDDVDVDVRKVVFRIAQEAVQNVVKHARAGRATVRVEVDGERVVLTVRDDGVGIGGPPSNGAGEGLGMRGMAERAEALGGEVHVERDAVGTVVTARLPRISCRVL